MEYVSFYIIKFFILKSTFLLFFIAFWQMRLMFIVQGTTIFYTIHTYLFKLSNT